ncbi:MAG: helix-turn-helix domain-containing protein [Nonomuraea sp.]|nr:helix-turn-helix domain-containing protein [Nonomuraea sp.]NUP69353.1 helix-turn-helix domain-containing protein [Nonomuraea sp.]NUS03303.1 helix-turn-helix domain-containing protein [Nonomuraea sp.]NUT10459.1 helix-turn-helix domain-containing protein [Nonomuraea sp.]
MIGEINPTLRRRKLAAELRRLREGAGLNGVQVAKSLRWSTSKISRMENGQVAPSPKDVTRLLEHYGTDGELGDLLLALARHGGSKGWWESYSDVVTEPVLELFGLEDGASRVRSWHTFSLPGLLQTRDYATRIGLLNRAVELAPPSRIERRIQARMRRQRLLSKEPPLCYSAVLDEAVLRRRFGDGDTKLMREQLRHLVKLSDLPNIAIRVLRLEQPHPTDITNFMLLSFPSIPVLGSVSGEVVYYENFPSFTLAEDEETAFQYSLVFDLLEQAAMDEDESRDFVAALADQL